MEQFISYFEISTSFVFGKITNIILSCIILIISWLVSSFLGNFTQNTLQKSQKIDFTIIPILKTSIIWSIRLFIIITILGHFGVQTTSIIAIIGTAGIAIGLALQGTLQNIAAGIMLLILRPIRADETVSIDNSEESLVKEVGLFLTRLANSDGTILIMPNSTIWGSTIKNYSRNQNRRLDIYIPINYDDAVDKALYEIRSFIETNNSFLPVPKPMVNISDYKDSYILINIRVWVLSCDHLNIKWQLNYKIWEIINNLKLRKTKYYLTNDVRKII